jgi:hypothetical protein
MDITEEVLEGLNSEYQGKWPSGLPTSIYNPMTIVYRPWTIDRQVIHKW